MDEFELIRRYFTRASDDADLVLGIGDDGAIVRPEPGRELVVVIDTLVEGIHFPKGLNPCDIGYRAVAVNLSDIAAMAARPRWMTLALTLTDADPDWLSRFSNGLFQAAAEHSVKLIGGDTTRGKEIVVTVQLTGDVAPDAALRRSGAGVGDEIYVTGTPGDAAAGLDLALADSVRIDDEQYLYRRFTRPTARVGFATKLAPHATAAIDVSDGLVADLGKLLDASGLGGRIEIERLPLSDSLVAVRGVDAAVDLALGGGDDYEIAFTAPAAKAKSVARLAESCSLRVSRIGTVTRDVGLRLFRRGEELPIMDSGYRHFSAENDD